MKILEKIVDISTGEETIIERDETKDEIAARKISEAKRLEMLNQSEARLAARQTVLDKLGLTADEAAALLG